MFTAYIGLGANLGDAVATLQSAVAELRTLPQSQLGSLSRLYRSTPIGPAGQPDYLNAAARLETTLTPHALLAALQAIENLYGRVREVRWGARTLDLDILLFDHDVIATQDLVVPHAELEKRNFVLLPLLDMDAGLQLPDGRFIRELSAAQDDGGLHIENDSARWADNRAD